MIFGDFGDSVARDPTQNRSYGKPQAPKIPVMSLKKQTFASGEIAIFDDAIIYKRGEFWQFRMWLVGEGKYARKSLKTRNESTAREKGKDCYLELLSNQKAGKKYFSLTTKEGVEKYLASREHDVETGQIVIGRLGTIKTHLGHWLGFIGKDTKLKELERTDCEDYFHYRIKNSTKKKLSISQTTVANEQSTINAMLAWLFRRNEASIDHFEFKPLKRIDKGDESLRRSMFIDEEIADIKTYFEKTIAEARKNLADPANFSATVMGYYFLISIITGLRRGEQLQLKWSDIEWLEKQIAGSDPDDTYSLVKVSVRAETTKVRKSRRFVVNDPEYFGELQKLMYSRYRNVGAGRKSATPFNQTLVFSMDGSNTLTARALEYHFARMLKAVEIKNLDHRDLVPYSFRHYFVTDRINRGATLKQVAETCGTSAHQIENTYYHMTEAKMITNALPQFDYRNEMLVRIVKP